MVKTIRVLIVEDSKDDAFLIIEGLKEGGYAPDAERVENCNEMKLALSEKTWDIVIADYNLPHFSAPEALSVLHDFKLDLPFIVVSGEIGEDIAVEIMKLGAHDYLMKGKLKRLNAAVEREIKEAVIRTERKKALQELKKTKEQLLKEVEFKNTLMQSTPMFFVAINSKGRTLFINKSMLEALNYTEDEVLDRDYITTFVPEDERVNLERVFDRLLVSHAPTFNENHIVAKSGKKYFVEWHGAPIFDEKGNFDYFFGVGLDITKRIRVEDELRGLKENLEVAVIKKAKELMEVKDKVTRFEKLAILGKLAGIVAHELRTPLGVIKNSVYFMKSKLEKINVDEKITNQLDVIDAEVCVSDRIIEDILTFARIKEPQIEGVDVKELIKAAINKVVISEEIQIILKIQKDLPQVLVDKEHMVLVFLNIITNALQSMEAGGNLTLGAYENEDYIEIEIADTGVGIPKVNLNKIFDPLYTTKIRGTGLGLSVCQSIVNLHKGKIKVESEEDKGTIFRVSLPSKQNS